MKRLQLIVEGQTEETLANELLIPHFQNIGWIVGPPMIVKTKTVADGTDHKGGLGSWAKLRPQIVRMLGSNFDLVTTMFDYYGFPSDAPGMASRPAGHGHARAQWVERALADDLGDPRFLPHLMVHETEALVLAAAPELGTLIGDATIADVIKAIVDRAGGPELVNDDSSTAPSKRLLGLVPTYRKLIDGPLAITECGLAVLRTQCPHFDAWVSHIEEAVVGDAMEYGRARDPVNLDEG